VYTLALREFSILRLFDSLKLVTICPVEQKEELTGLFFVLLILKYLFNLILAIIPEPGLPL
jgi:hypothetical protein